MSCSRFYQGTEAVYGVFSAENVGTTTSPFREHIKWREVANYCIEHFKDKTKVNIYSLGCSDGSEDYSWAMILADILPKEQLQKYFPIIACDIDPEVIKAAATGRVNLDSSDFRTISKNTLNVGRNQEGIFTGENLLIKSGRPVKLENDLNQTEDSHSIFDPLNSYFFAEPVADSVQFSVAEVLHAVRNIKDEGNSIVNISHVLGYCKQDYIDEVTKELGEKLKKGSLYIFDRYNNTPEYWDKLRSLGFYAPFGEDCCIAEKL